MFLNLRVEGEHSEELSWLLSKHPERTVERQLSKRGMIFGKFVEYRPDCAEYDTILVPTPGGFLRFCKAENLSHYVLYEEHGVVPTSTGMITEIFNSAIKGQIVVDEEFGLTEEKGKEMVNRERWTHVSVGPLPLKSENYLLSLFQGSGFSAAISKQGKEVGALHVWKIAPVFLVLQQVYILLTSASSRGSREGFKMPADSRVQKFIRLSESWLKEHPKSEGIIWGLTHSRQKKRDMIEGVGDEEDERTKPLNAFRYNWFIDKVKEHSPRKVLDIGCGSGNLLVRLMRGKFELLGLEMNPERVSTARHRTRKSPAKVRLGNALYPPAEAKEADLIILSEVIEHLDIEEDLPRLMDVLFGYLQPDVVLLSTPNRDYNKFFDLEEGELRHKDHQVEFSKEGISQLAATIADTYGYEVRVSSIGEEKEGMRPTHTLECLRTEQTVPIKDIGLGLLGEPFTILGGKYEVRPKEIFSGAEGYTNRQVRPRQVIHLAPTMSPPSAQAAPEGFLEHPLQAIEYYKERDIRHLRAQHKYMGSRGIFIAGSDPDIWAKYFSKSLDMFVSYSRRLYQILNDEDREPIYKAMLSYMKDAKLSLLAIDCEVMPWAYRGLGLINREFVLPGEAGCVARGRWSAFDEQNKDFDFAYENALAYMESLHNYSQEGPLELRPFSTVLEINQEGKIKCEWELKSSEHEERSFKLAEYSNLFAPVVGMPVDAENKDLVTACIRNWEEFCAEGGEGFVFKPENPEDRHPLMQPAVKVRGRDYLRIIYGMDYLSHLDKLRRRNTRQKRWLALRQQAISRRLTAAFLEHTPVEKRIPLVFGFLGLDKITRVDATL